MEYLGQFLSTNNNITEDQDTVTKYFFYRPDKYDTPSADLETIFDLRAMPNFPQIGDLLSENEAFELKTIDISKKVEEDNDRIKRNSYVVTCSYENMSGGGIFIGNTTDRNDDVQVDIDGNRVDATTLPWKLRTQWGSQSISVEVPFTKAYDYAHPTSGAYVNVVNSAGKRLLASTTRYRRVFTFKFNSQNQRSSLVLSACYVNSNAYYLPISGSWLIPSGQLMIEPPTFEVKFFEKQETQGTAEHKKIIKTLIPYYEYSVKMTWDPQGWEKKLLNIGTFARFAPGQPSEQIYSYHTISGAMPGPINFTNLAGVMKAGGNGATLSGIAWEKVTEPLPLNTSGGIYMNAINNPERYPYLVRSFPEYQALDFSNLNIPRR